jgi:hypothetical protein
MYPHPYAVWDMGYWFEPQTLYGVPPQWQRVSLGLPLGCYRIEYLGGGGDSDSITHLCLMHIELSFVSKLVTEIW